MLLRMMVLLTLALGAGVACGSKSEEEEGARNACGAAPAALSGAPQLPEKFPTPDGVTYTADEKKGPSRVVEGYFAGELEQAYEAYKDAFPDAGYDVTKDEREEDDAEVNFGGAGTNGQVKLIQECADRTSVAITVRPE